MLIKLDAASPHTQTRRAEEARVRAVIRRNGFGGATAVARARHLAADDASLIRPDRARGHPLRRAEQPHRFVAFKQIQQCDECRATR